jgi:pyruvate/2-oxoglutarate/acetoin dehydrogenase E1 component
MPRTIVIPTKTQVEPLRTVIGIRAFEGRVRDLFAAGRLPGFVHLSIGQEGVAAKDVPIPFSPPLEEHVLPQIADIVAAVRKVVQR